MGMLNWVIPLNMERALRVLVDTFYSKVAKKCIPVIQSTEYIEFRTRYTSLLSDYHEGKNFMEHYPFD